MLLIELGLKGSVGHFVDTYVLEAFRVKVQRGDTNGLEHVGVYMSLAPTP
jgi:hypothetical protein